MTPSHYISKAFIGITAMVKMDYGVDNKDDANAGSKFFFITLMLVVVSAACTSFFQGGLFGLTYVETPLSDSVLHVLSRTLLTRC